MLKQRIKTGICYANQRGECDRGDSCRYSHDSSKTQGNNSERSQGICYANQRGECERGDSCRYSHDSSKKQGNRGGGGSQSMKHGGSGGSQSMKHGGGGGSQSMKHGGGGDNDRGRLGSRYSGGNKTSKYSRDSKKPTIKPRQRQRHNNNNRPKVVEEPKWKPEESPVGSWACIAKGLDEDVVHRLRYAEREGSDQGSENCSEYGSEQDSGSESE